MGSDTLLHEFPPVSTQAWEDVIAKDLKGADYAKKLVWQTEEGLAVKPYYRAEDIVGLEYLDAAPGNFPFVRGDRAAADWRIREEIEALDPAEANRAACAAVVAGAEEIAFLQVQIAGARQLAGDSRSLSGCRGSADSPVAGEEGTLRRFDGMGSVQESGLRRGSNR